MAAQRSRRQFLGYGAAALGTGLLLKACGGATPSSNQGTPASPNVTSPGGDRFRAAIVLPGIISDQAWNQAGYEGMNVVKTQLQAEVNYIEKVSQADQAEALSDFARQGYNVVFAHGGQFDAATQQIASQFPDTYFVVVNGAATGPNVASLRINSLELGYLCGLIGASLTRTGRMAYLAGQEFEATRNEFRGFELGARSVKPTIQVSASFTGDWNDPAKAREAFVALAAAGADVVYQWLDNAAPAVLQAASDRGLYVFGNTTDQLAIAPNAVLTSAVKRIDMAIAFVAKLAKDRQLNGEIYTVGLEKPDIVYLGKFNPVVSASLQQKVAQAREAIVSQSLTFTPCTEGTRKTYCVNTKGATKP